MPSPLGQAVRSSWGPVTVCPTTSIWFTHASHGMVIADDRESILCGGAPPRGLSDETTSLGTMATAMESKSQLQPFNTSNLDDFCSAKTLQKGSKGVVPQGELQGFWLQSHLQQSRQHDPLSYSTAFFQGIGFHRRPLFQVALLPDPSEHSSGCLE